jgi:hypothetical protein
MKTRTEVETPIAGARNAEANGARPARKSAKRKQEASEPPAPEKLKGHSIAEEAKLSKGNFFHRMAQMTQDDWDRHRVYVYRRWPRISRDGQPHYIAVHREPVDEEFIKTMYGSGRFLLKLNDARHTIDQAALEIMDLACPPKVSPDELVDAPENERYHKLWPAEENKKPDGNNDAAAVRELAGLVKLALGDKHKDEQGTVTKTLIDWALAQKDKERADSSPTAIANLVKELKGILPAQQAPQQTDMAALLHLAKELQPPPPPPAPNPLELLEQAKALFSPPQDDLQHIDRLLGIADKLSGLRGGAAGGHRSAWDVGLDYVKELVPLAPYLGNLMGLRIPGMGGTPAPGAANGTPPAAPSAFDPYANPQALRSHANNLTAQQPSPAAAPASPGTAPLAAPPAAAPANGAAPSNDLLSVFQQYGALVVNALNNGTPGYDFADYVCGLLGKGTHAMIASHGEDALVATMKSIPEIALFGEPRLRTFTAEFIDFERYLNEMEEPAPEGQVGATA